MSFKKKFSTIFFVLGSLVLFLSFTNCSPIHEEEATFTSVINSVCDNEFESIFQSVETEASCASCHFNNAVGKPFLMDYESFLNTFTSSGSHRNRVEISTMKVIDRLRNGSNATHFKQEAAAASLQSSLTQVLQNFDECAANAAEQTGIEGSNEEI